PSIRALLDRLSGVTLLFASTRAAVLVTHQRNSPLCRLNTTLRSANSALLSFIGADRALAPCATSNRTPLASLSALGRPRSSISSAKSAKCHRSAPIFQNTTPYSVVSISNHAATSLRLTKLPSQICSSLWFNGSLAPVRVKLS